MVWEIQLIINHNSKVSGYFCNLKITLYQWQSVRSRNRSQELSWLATVQLGYFCAVDASSRLAPLFSSVTLIGWFYNQSFHAPAHVRLPRVINGCRTPTDWRITPCVQRTNVFDWLRFSPTPRPSARIGAGLAGSGLPARSHFSDSWCSSAA